MSEVEIVRDDFTDKVWVSISLRVEGQYRFFQLRVEDIHEAIEALEKAKGMVADLYQGASI